MIQDVKIDVPGLSAQVLTIQLDSRTLFAHTHGISNAVGAARRKMEEQVLDMDWLGMLRAAVPELQDALTYWRLYDEAMANPHPTQGDIPKMESILREMGDLRQKNYTGSRPYDPEERIAERISRLSNPGS